MINFFTTNFNIKKMNERELKELLLELLKKMNRIHTLNLKPI